MILVLNQILLKDFYTTVKLNTRCSFSCLLCACVRARVRACLPPSIRLSDSFRPSIRPSVRPSFRDFRPSVRPFVRQPVPLFGPIQIKCDVSISVEASIIVIISFQDGVCAIRILINDVLYAVSLAVALGTTLIKCEDTISSRTIVPYHQQ